MLYGCVCVYGDKKAMSTLTVSTEAVTWKDERNAVFCFVKRFLIWATNNKDDVLYERTRVYGLSTGDVDAPF